MKDMTYLFLVIAIGLINAVTKIKDASDNYEYSLLGLINGIIIFVAYMLDSQILFRKELVQIITYDNIELINQNNEELLMMDIKKRTGINVIRVSISKIDFLKDSAQIKVYYYQVKE